MRTRTLGWWLYQPYKYLVIAPLVALATVFFSAWAVLLSFVARSRLVARTTAVPWARLLALLTPMQVEVVGRSNVDPRQSYVLVSNHQSQYDILVLYGWLGVDFKWVIKQELRQVPCIGIACELLGHIFIDRSNHAAALASLEAAKAKITDGTSVIFFPEGTRSRNGRLLPFKRGAFRMALDLGLPVLPLTVSGTREVLPAGTTDLMPGRARLEIHPPVATEGLTSADAEQLANTVRDIISSGLPAHETDLRGAPQGAASRQCS